MTDEPEKTCPLGDDCDMTLAYMHGHSEGRLALEAENKRLRAEVLAEALQAVRRVEVPIGGWPQDRAGVWVCALEECASAIEALEDKE